MATYARYLKVPLTINVILLFVVTSVYAADTPGPFNLPHPGGYPITAYYDIDRSDEWVLD